MLSLQLTSLSIRDALIRYSPSSFTSAALADDIQFFVWSPGDRREFLRLPFDTVSVHDSVPALDGNRKSTAGAPKWLQRMEVQIITNGVEAYQSVTNFPCLLRATPRRKHPVATQLPDTCDFGMATSVDWALTTGFNLRTTTVESADFGHSAGELGSMGSCSRRVQSGRLAWTGVGGRTDHFQNDTHPSVRSEGQLGRISSKRVQAGEPLQPNGLKGVAFGYFNVPVRARMDTPD